ncbi:hypothetical protein B0T24DRAFT_295903 [Lasiosphaeria ovina]|uniref:Uncharacterized protein n=1 Tax=Lasiosphaeria ovina TaxID=92902 RepID=A0AAE0KD92_9PEZI|nr:hypothetical protein B0T24DRAFT_295903 [Lasiosphaeria ovina]
MIKHIFRAFSSKGVHGYWLWVLRLPFSRAQEPECIARRSCVFWGIKGGIKGLAVIILRVIGLDWTGLDWTGLDWTGLDWTGLDWTCLWIDGRTRNGRALEG